MLQTTGWDDALDYGYKFRGYIRELGLRVYGLRFGCNGLGSRVWDSG